MINLNRPFDCAKGLLVVAVLLQAFDHGAVELIRHIKGIAYANVGTVFDIDLFELNFS